jgi:hypothetical protein
VRVRGATLPPVRELAAGFWRWQAPHPEWTADEPWAQEVSSYALDDGERLLLFDPLAVPDDLLELALRWTAHCLRSAKPLDAANAAWRERFHRGARVV